MRQKTSRVFIFVLFSCIFLMTLRPIADPDFWWHLRTGQYIAETGSPPNKDVFSFTASGNTWVAHEWLTEMMLYTLFRMGGYGLLIILFSAIITLAFGFAYLASPGKPYVAGFSILLCSLVTAPVWGVRPQMISFLFAAVFLYILNLYQVNRRGTLLLFLPPISVLWVNLHAGYFLGFGILGIYIIGEIITIFISTYHQKPIDKKSLGWLMLTLVACVVVSLANPNTYSILIYPFETLTSDSMMRFIQEWFSPDFHQKEWIPFAILLLALIAAPSIFRQPVNITNLLLALGFGFAALRSMRHIPFFALTATSLLASQFQGLSQKAESHTIKSRWACWANSMILVVTILMVALRFYQVLDDQPLMEEKNFPRLATNWILENRPRGEIYNTYSWGGYLIWRLYPDYPVYIDGRADVYGDEFIYDYLAIYNGSPGWDSALTQAEVSMVIIEPTSGLANVIEQSPEWTLAYQDTLCVLYIRR